MPQLAQQPLQGSLIGGMVPQPQTAELQGNFMQAAQQQLLRGPAEQAGQQPGGGLMALLQRLRPMIGQMGVGMLQNMAPRPAGGLGGLGGFR